MQSLVASLCLLMVGCVTNVSRFQMPGTDLADVRTLYVDLSEDARGADELRSLVDANLERRGFSVATLMTGTVFGEGDYVLDVAPDWHWDLSWYLLELRLAIYEPGNRILVAQAHSMQSSLKRKNTEVVVEQAMASLFDDPIP